MTNGNYFDIPGTALPGTTPGLESYGWGAEPPSEIAPDVWGWSQARGWTKGGQEVVGKPPWIRGNGADAQINQSLEAFSSLMGKRGEYEKDRAAKSGYHGGPEAYGFKLGPGASYYTALHNTYKDVISALIVALSGVESSSYLSIMPESGLYFYAEKAKEILQAQLPKDMWAAIEEGEEKFILSKSAGMFTPPEPPKKRLYPEQEPTEWIAQRPMPEQWGIPKQR